MKVLVTGGSGFIGSNLINDITKKDHEIINADIAEPKVALHHKYWNKIDILDYSGLISIFEANQPEAVIHLAAETDCNPRLKIEDYNVNIEGTKNVLQAVKETESVERVIITSTQYVHQGKQMPTSDTDYDPHTIYGESKIESEKLTREMSLQCTWTIIRPTNIWGPWHLRYPFEFWKVLKEGKYFQN